MPKSKSVTLGISIGVQQVGIALAINEELVDWSTLSFKERWSERKPQRVWSRIKAIINARGVTKVILLVPVSIRSRILAFVDEKLDAIATVGLISYERRSLDQLKGTFSEPIRNKRHLYEMIQERVGFSELDLSFTRSRLNQYHGKMLEAIGLIVNHIPIRN